MPPRNLLCAPDRALGSAGVRHRGLSRGFGETGPWDLFYASPDEVYVWRAPIEGAVIETPDDAQLVLRAIAKAQINKLDAKAIAFVLRGQADQQAIDVLFTADSTIPYTIPQSAKRLAEAAEADPALRQRFPGIAFPDAQWLELTGPPDAIDFWRAHEIVWDDSVGPTDAFAKLKGIYKGQADDGPRVTAWTKKPPDLNGGKNGGHPGTSSALTYVGLALGTAAIVWLGAHWLVD